MHRVRRIQAATDLSESAGQAVERAARLAAEQGVQLDLLHVVKESALESLRSLLWQTPGMPERLVDHVRKSLQEQASEIAARVSITTTSRVAIGRVLPEILATCATDDLLVIGAHGQNWVRDVILGTTAERLLGKCPGPVLVVKRAPTSAYREVLVAADLSACSQSALRAAIQLAPNAHITVIHAFEVPFEGQLQRAGVAETQIEILRQEGKQKAIVAIRDLIYRASNATQRIDYVVEHGHVLGLIRDREGAQNADLIVVCKRARSLAEAWLLGSMTRHIVSDSKCDVLVAQQDTGSE